MESIDHFLDSLNSDSVEKAILKLLSIGELDVGCQHLVIKALNSIDTELNQQILRRSIIWDQIIRSSGREETINFMNEMLTELKFWGYPEAVLDNPEKIHTVFSKMEFDLESEHLCIQRDNITLYNEQILVEKLFKKQQEIACFIEKIYLGLTQDQGGFQIRNGVSQHFLYALKNKREELILQSSVILQSIESLKMIQRNNQILLIRITGVLTNSWGLKGLIRL
jgi:hypothetical protein